MSKLYWWIMSVLLVICFSSLGAVAISLLYPRSICVVYGEHVKMFDLHDPVIEGEENDRVIVSKLEDGSYVVGMHGCEDGRVFFEDHAISRKEMLFKLVDRGWIPNHAKVVLVCCYPNNGESGHIVLNDKMDVEVDLVFKVKTQIHWNNLDNVRLTNTLQVWDN